MSLSTFVERPDVKAYLRENVPKPWFEVHAEIKAPPLTTSYGWTGTAFDYAMRFYLQKLNPSAKTRRWLAEESVPLVIASRHETARTKKRVLGTVETAKDCVRSYLKSKRDAKPGREVIRAAVDLAQLDLVYRMAYWTCSQSTTRWSKISATCWRSCGRRNFERNERAC